MRALVAALSDYCPDQAIVGRTSTMEFAVVWGGESGTLRRALMSTSADAETTGRLNVGQVAYTTDWVIVPLEQTGRSRRGSRRSGDGARSVENATCGRCRRPVRSWPTRSTHAPIAAVRELERRSRSGPRAGGDAPIAVDPLALPRLGPAAVRGQRRSSSARMAATRHHSSSGVSRHSQRPDSGHATVSRPAERWRDAAGFSAMGR